MQSIAGADCYCAKIASLRWKQRFNPWKQIPHKRRHRIRSAILRCWLGDIVGCALCQRFECYAGAPTRKRAAHDDLCFVMARAQFCQHLKTIHAGHLKVQKNQVRLEALDSFESIDAVSSHPG